MTENQNVDKKKKLIIIEDSEDHIFLIKRELGKNNFDLDITVAKSAEEVDPFLTSESFPFDIVLLDYSLPEKSGLEILDSIRNPKSSAKIDDTTHVILTTGMGSEKVAAEALRLGADDYIIKEVNFVSQVAKAVSHALERIQLKEEIKFKDEALRKSELKYRMLFQVANDGIAIIGSDETILEANERFLTITGQDKVPIGHHYLDIFLPEYREKISRLLSTPKKSHNSIKVQLEGEKWGEISVSVAKISEEYAYAIMIIRDITENKKLEANLREQTERLENALLQEK